MITLKWVIALSLLFCCCVVDAQLKNGFKRVVSHLGEYQDANGGFRNADGVPTAKATADALLITSLYHLRKQVNASDIPKFLESLANSDGGYANVPKAKSDVEATRDVVFSYERLGLKTPHASKTADYVKTLVDKSSGLFALQNGGSGSIRATAAALQTLEVLGEVDQKWVQDLKAGINTKLKAAQSLHGLFYTNETDVSQIAGTYQSIVAGSFTGYDFGASAPLLGAAIAALQSAKGQFYEDFAKTRTSVQATADATVALYVLDRITKGNYVDYIRHSDLRSALRYIHADVTSAANAHVALAVTRELRDSFQISTFLQGSDPQSDRVFEGAEVTPAVVVAGHDAGIAHGGFAIDVATKFHGAVDAVKSKLRWDQESQRYLGDALQTLGKFGPLQIGYTLSSLVPGLGKISFGVNDTRHVGYGIVVVPRASDKHSGKQINEGEAVTIGTDFQFAVSLDTQANRNLVTGDFIFTFTVEDSSHVVLHEEKVDGTKNTKPLAFQYTLTTPSVPSGLINFRFDVTSKSGKQAHTTKTISYPLVVAMVATNIVFEGSPKGQIPTYKIGDKVKLSFDAATFPDLRNTHVISSKDNSARQFLLDVKTPQGTVVETVNAVAKGTGYHFEFPVEPKFEDLGPNILSIRYKPKHGEEIVLQNFDSVKGELYEDSEQLSYAVKATLSISDVTEKPTSGELLYGNEIVFKFRVKDEHNNYVWSHVNSPANVYLELQHEEEPGTARSSASTVLVPAVSDGKDFVIRWTVNPNARRGPGVLSLVALDTDGNKIALKNAPSLKVDVGGKITVKSDYYVASPLDTTFGAFVVDLNLYCGKALLKDAQLRASVVHTDGKREEQVATLPVSHHNGTYTVGWTAPHTLSKSGTYQLKFYREVDRAHALEKRDAQEKKQRKERQAKGETDVETASTDVNLKTLGLEPIFTVDIPYSAPRLTRLPIQPQFLALVTFGSIVLWLIKKRSSLH